MIDLNKHKLKLNYPCSWKYKVVVLKDTNTKCVCDDVFKGRKHNLCQSNVSKNGKFKSYDIELLVHNDEDREELHKLLNAHQDIKMVL
ncbi:MAG: DUF493 domain-containing protein [Arcobacter sp.]|nr:MAG: DUF493 domain-containing protein [Arcobacter sp.]